MQRVPVLGFAHRSQKWGNATRTHVNTISHAALSALRAYVFQRATQSAISHSRSLTPAAASAREIQNSPLRLAPLHWFRESLARTLLRMDIADQKKAVTDLAFEVYHFRCYSRLYRDSQLALVLRQAVIYSLLLHVRVLLGFFSGRPVQDDCWMGDFVTDTAARKKLTPSSAAKALVPELHKRLAHFTRTRWEKAAPKMYFYAAYFDEIEVLITEFQAALPTDVREAFTTKLDWFGKNEPCAI